MVILREYAPGSAEVVVVVAERNALRVVVGVSAGQLDGGSHQTWRPEDVPPDLRHDGARFWIDPRSRR